MRTNDFDFDLPPELIAQHAVARGTSRLLVVDADNGPTSHRSVSDLPELLQPGDLLVVNDTRVLSARLLAKHPETGGKLEILLIEPAGDGLDDTVWEVLAKPAKKAKPRSRFQLDDSLDFEVLERLDQGRTRIRFSQPIEPHLERLGHVPLPPYIRRADEATDRERYQTVFAQQPGAIAAPTAGLHFSQPLLDALEQRQISTVAITLHVGIGTFRPVTVEQVDEHEMEAERYEISSAAAETIETARRDGRRIVAVGTTAVRTLEAVAERHDGRIVAESGRTALFIRPGFRFRAVDALLTNFHLPRSTLLMLVSALAGRERVMAAYRRAVEAGYRFYSYGDAMLIERRLPQ